MTPDPTPEVRLRAALHAVAATTLVDPPDDLLARPAPLEAPRRRIAPRRLLAAAAVLVVLVVVAAVALAGRSTTTVRTGDAPAASTPVGTAPPAPATGPPTIGDHWHAAYGIEVCGRFAAPQIDRAEDRLGIHTHNDGIIHIHPFTPESSGERATLGLFLDQAGIVLDDAGRYLSLADGTSFTAGATTCDGQPAELRVRTWSLDHPEAGFETATERLRSIRLEDRQAITIAVVPAGADRIPQPPSVETLDHLSDVPAS